MIAFCFSILFVIALAYFDAQVKGHVVVFADGLKLKYLSLPQADFRLPEWWRDGLGNRYNILVLTLGAGIVYIMAILLIFLVFGLMEALKFAWMAFWGAITCETIGYWWWLPILKIKQIQQFKGTRRIDQQWEYPDLALWLGQYTKFGIRPTRRFVYSVAIVTQVTNLAIAVLLN